MSGAPVSLSLGLTLLLLATLSFYRQRSLLAWYYGQMALEDSGHITGQGLREWLQDADGWDTWMHYQRGFLLLAGAFGDLILAGLTAYLKSTTNSHGASSGSGFTTDAWGGGAWTIFVLAVLVVHKLILEKWPQSQNPYREFRRAPLSILFRPKRPSKY